MKYFLFLFLFPITLFAAGPTYKVTEFVKVKNTDTGLIESAIMSVECMNGSVKRTETGSLTSEEILVYEKNASAVTAIAERIASLAKAATEQEIKETSKILIVKDSQATLDAIAIDPVKVTSK